MKMKKYLLLFLLLIMIIPINAQETSPYQEEINRCAGSSSIFDSRALCEAFIPCQYENLRLACIETLIISALSQCKEQALEQCEALTLMYIPAVDLLSNLSEEQRRQVMTNAFYFSEGNYEAISWQTLFDDPNYQPYFLHYLSAGALHHYRGTDEEAVEYLTQSIALQYDNPLAFYLRAQAYTALGETDLAGRDALVFEQMQTPELAEAITPLDISYEMPELETWVNFPLQRTIGGPGGSSITDMTMDAPFPVNFAYLDEDKTLLIGSLRSGFEEANFLTPSSENPTLYSVNKISQTIPFIMEGSESTLSITVYPDHMLYRHFSVGSESFVVWDGVLLPDDAVDPRIDLVARVCEGLPLSFIRIGDFVNSTLLYYSDPIWSEPDTNSQPMEVAGGMPVEAGPVCTEEYIWWQVSVGETTGWIHENEGQEYRFAPILDIGAAGPSLFELLGFTVEDCFFRGNKPSCYVP